MIETKHLFKFWDKLTPQEREDLKNQIENLPYREIETLGQKSPHITSLPIEQAEERDPALQKEGERLIRLGLVGTLVMAGGQGTRLQYSGPKGLFPISPLRKKSLFQLLAERVKAASKRAKRPLLMAIMVSPFDIETIRLYFEQMRFFGLKREQIHLFSQGTMPLFTQDRRLFLSDKGHLAVGSSGNGVLLHHFVKSGAAAYFRDKGISIVNTVLIDNPLADPYDAILSSTCYNNKDDVTIKCIKRDSPDEQVGLVVNTDKGVRVAEYTELPKDVRQDKRYNLANISLFAFSIPFIFKAAGRVDELPFHLHEKEAMGIPPDSDDPTPQKMMACRYERFIFDNLPFADKITPLVYPRGETFAPLKRAAGEGSIASVQEALQRRDKEVYQEVTGLKSPDRPFELSLDFHYPTSVLMRLWKNRPLPDGDYIEP